MLSTTVLMFASIIGGEAEVNAETTKPIHVPADVVKALDYFVGRWESRVKGDNAKATWDIQWEPGKACLRGRQVWRDKNGTDVGAGIWGYDPSKKEILYTQFYVTGANATMRYNYELGTTWKGTMRAVNDATDVATGKIVLERINDRHFVWKSMQNKTDAGESLPDVLIEFHKK